jgi:hypothetical protein
VDGGNDGRLAGRKVLLPEVGPQPCTLEHQHGAFYLVRRPDGYAFCTIQEPRAVALLVPEGASR